MIWLEIDFDAVDRKSAADYLESVAKTIREYPKHDAGAILDVNGNKVGFWSISPINEMRST